MPALNLSPLLKSPLNPSKRHYLTSNSSWIALFDGIRAKEVRYVRFLLSPPPEEETMATRQQPPRAAREPRVVLPTTPKEEEIKFGSSNTWGRNELKLLNVHVEWNRRIDLNDRVLKVKASEWSPELRARMTRFKFPLNDRYCRWLETISIHQYF